MIQGRLGRYVVERMLGAGGMSEVYLARDPDLDRPVALKVLPAEVADDPERRTRLRREARLAAALSHPHVATVYEVFEDRGKIVIALEYVEGSSLHRLLRDGPLPVPRVLRLGAQAADALAAAHRQGIVHRDVKPDNILVTTDGLAKVTDFGLARESGARAASSGGSREATASEPLTEPGAVLGTAPYMAPEQVQGREATAQSDIFSLGATLYEAATGRRPFGGATSAGTFAAILRDRPPLPSAINPEVPADLDRILMRALEKQPADRYHDARDFAADLRDLRRRIESVSSQPTAPQEVPPASRRWRIVAAGAVVLALVALVAWSVRERDESVSGASPGRMRLLVASDSGTGDPAISQDGTMVAFVADENGVADLYVARTGGGGRLRLTRDAARESRPVFSGDGERVVYTRWDASTGEPDVMTIPSLGGNPAVVVRGGSQACPSPDGKRLAYVASAADGSHALVVSRADGSEPREILRGEAGRPFLRHPSWSPDGTTIALSRSRGGESHEVWLVGADGSRARRLIDDPPGVFSHDPEFTPDGRAVLHVSNRTGARNIWSAPVDGSAPPQRLTTGAGPDLSPGIARNGTIVFSNERSRAVLLTLDTATREVREVFRETSPLWAPRFSPDDREIVFSRGSTSGAWHVWTIPATGGTPRQVTSGDLPELYGSYSSDGRWIVYQSWSPGPDRIWRVPSEGGAPEPLTPEGDEEDGFPALSPDGRTLAFTRAVSGVDRLHLMPFGGGEARALTAGPSNVAAWSPDGTWIAFARDRGCDGGIFVIRPDGTGERRLTERGGWPVFTPDGARVAYQAVGPEGLEELRVVALAGGPSSRMEGISYRGSNFPFGFSRSGRLLVTTNSEPVSAEIWLLER